MALGALQPQEQIVNPYSPSPVTTHPPAPRAKGKWVGGREQAAKLSLRKPLPAPWGQFQVPTPSPRRLTIGGEGLDSKGMKTEPRHKQTAPLALLVQRLGKVRGILPLEHEEMKEKLINVSATLD